MAARPGEENVATLFGDIHYFYAPPDTKPCHHRFDKGSYVYLFENASDKRCRIEIANHPGTDDQDAFDGFLDQARVGYTYRHHCMVSLTVADAVDQGEWHLPTYDPRNEIKYHYKLHSLDIYFLTQQDALQFVNGVRRVLPPSQVEVLDEPGPPPQQQPAGMSSVVQKLERAAIGNPQYGASTASSQHTGPGSVSGGGAATASPETIGAMPPPPPPPPPPPADFAPMAYNPAAPAAPEAIRHREKTPPPDEDPLNPLAVAVAHDYQKQPFTPGFPPPCQFATGISSPGVPPLQFAAHSQPLLGLQRAATVPVHHGMASPYGPSFPGSPGFAAPAAPQAASQPTPPAMSAGLQAPPAGDHGSYSYSQQAPARQLMQDYSIHQQVYRPTEAETGPRPHQQQTRQEPRGRLEEGAAKLERGVSGMLKKIEKKFG